MTKGILSFCMDLPSVRKLLEVVGGDLRAGENRTSWLYRVADDVGVSYRVIKAVWWGERLTLETAYKLKRAAKLNEERNRRIAERFEGFADSLCKNDEEFFRNEITYYRELARRIRNLNGGKE